MWCNTKKTYGSVAKIFHWLMAALILFLLGLGWFMTGAPALRLHQLFGLLALFLFFLRWSWKLCNPRPRLPATVSRLKANLAKTVQIFLYIGMCVMPFSGWAMSTAFGWGPHLGHLRLTLLFLGAHPSYGNFFQILHQTLAWILMGLISVHVLGVLQHRWIDKNWCVLRRMLPNFKK